MLIKNCKFIYMKKKIIIRNRIQNEPIIIKIIQVNVKNKLFFFPN
jgi:hypothetical protein